jgi:hypothetical protein
MGHTGVRRQSPGVLPVLQAFVNWNRRFDIASLDDAAFERTLSGGAGAILSYVTAETRDSEPSTRRNEVESADLTMRLMTAVTLETVEEVIATSRQAGIEPMLLKGCSSALRYYPEPHLRTMADVDLLVPERQHAALESQMLARGFERRSTNSPAFYDRHHHAMPFWHPARNVWIEIHTRPYPPISPLANAPEFSYEAVAIGPASVAVGAQTVRVMNHERQLVYTATRWAEMIKAESGIFPLLDAALLLRSCDGQLDWDEVCRLAEEPWAAGALVLMLAYLDRTHLARVPAAVLSRLGRRDRFSNAVVRNLLHRIVTRYVIEGRQPGPLLTPGNRRLVWSTLAAAKSPWAKLAELPVNVIFPPAAQGRFDPARVMRRLRTVVRGARG